MLWADENDVGDWMLVLDDQRTENSAESQTDSPTCSATSLRTNVWRDDKRGKKEITEKCLFFPGERKDVGRCS